MAIYSSSWLFEIMMTFSILSFIQVNVLYLRIVLISSAIFNIIWAFVGLKFQIDVIIFASTILIINIINSILLLIPILKIKVGKDELNLYYEIFSQFMTRYHYKKFIDSGKKEIFSHSSFRVVNEREQFGNLFLVVNPQNAYKSYIRRNNQILREYVRPYAWIGFPEMVNKMLNNPIEYEIQYDLVSVGSGKLIIYKFDSDKLADLFRRDIDFQNSLYSIWMKETMEWIQYFDLLNATNGNNLLLENSNEMKTKGFGQKFY